MRARLTITGIALALLAAACSGGETSTTSSESSTTVAPPTTGETPAGATSSTATDGGAALTATAADGWSLTTIGEGIKPVLALDPDDNVGIAYLLERLDEGFVAYADSASGWNIDTFVEGYFYGPIGLDFDSLGVPSIVWHDHQDVSFQPELGSLVYAVRTDAGWEMIDGTDDGHDGWDSTLALGPDDTVHAAGIDPSQFGSEDGVEYYRLSGGEFTVEAIGTGPVPYEFNVALAVAGDGEPALSYHDAEAGVLRFARRQGGTWSIETVDPEVGTGKYSSLAIDAEGRAHITYLLQTGSTTGVIRYAVEGADGSWTIEDIAELDSIKTGFTGARRITSLALAADGTPHVVFSDEATMFYGSRGEAGWQVTPVVTAGSRPLGQLVSMELASDGSVHIAFYEVTNDDPLAGVVGYLSSNGTS
ncbi:MAG: hypothetical protein BMS9Abin07_0317 [Acidimicrobiia bacterium]|nr:MAG: hypothetical protein BMS9Abin07_0317 [Acidimicrobiia bacterium]